jgi:hypothetical protein
VILGKTGKNSINEANKYGFKQILIQDSTIIKLPKKLFHLFFGVSNATVTVCNARIQVVFDLISQRFVSFTIDPYSKNDQSCVRELEIKEGDLTLRDRGYFNTAEIKRHIQSGADCIFRHKVGMKILDYETLKPVDLLEILKKNGSIDMVIRLNDPQRTAATPFRGQGVLRMSRSSKQRGSRGVCSCDQRGPGRVHVSYHVPVIATTLLSALATLLMNSLNSGYFSTGITPLFSSSRLYRMILSPILLREYL